MKELCFKSYDIRGIIGQNLDENIVYNIGRSVAEHFGSKSIVLGFDARETSSGYGFCCKRYRTKAVTLSFRIGWH